MKKFEKSGFDPVDSSVPRYVHVCTRVDVGSCSAVRRKHALPDRTAIAIRTSNLQDGKPTHMARRHSSVEPSKGKHHTFVCLVFLLFN